MNEEINMNDLQVVAKRDATLFAKYQLLLGDKQRAQRAYDAQLEETEMLRISFEFLHHTYHVIQDRMLETIVRLDRQAKIAQRESRKYYKGDKPRLGRLFAGFYKRLHSECGKLRTERSGLLKEMDRLQKQHNNSLDELNSAFIETITADNRYLEYCRLIENKLDKVLKSQGEI